MIYHSISGTAQTPTVHALFLDYNSARVRQTLLFNFVPTEYFSMLQGESVARARFSRQTENRAVDKNRLTDSKQGICEEASVCLYS